MTEPAHPYENFIQAASEAHNVDPRLIKRVMQQESSNNPEARSPAGAIGLMQLMPNTAAELGVDPSDPAQNVMGGTQYLREQLDRFNGSVPLALAAYNAGPGAVRKAGGVPNFSETRNYVNRISSDYDGAGYRGARPKLPIEQRIEAAQDAPGSQLMDHKGDEGLVLKAMFADRRYMSLPLREKFALLTSFSPTFARLARVDQAAAVRWMGLNTPRPGYTSAVFGSLGLSEEHQYAGEAGWQAGTAHILRLRANAAMLAHRSGLPDGDLWEEWDQDASAAEQRAGEMYQNLDGWGEKIVSAGAALPLGLGTAIVAGAGAGLGLMALGASAPAVALWAPIVGFGALGALGSAHMGPEEALKHGALEASFGALFGPTQHLGRMSRGAIVGTAAGSMSYAATGDEQQAIIDAGVMALLPAIHGKRDPLPRMIKLGAKDTKAARQTEINRRLDEQMHEQDVAFDAQVIAAEKDFSTDTPRTAEAGPSTAPSAREASVGDTVTVYDPLGNPRTGTVTAASELGARRVRLEGETEDVRLGTVWDDVNASSPEYVLGSVRSGDRGLSVRELSEDQLNHLVERTAEKVEVLKESGQRGPGMYGLLRDLNALRLEKRRRAETTPTADGDRTGRARHEPETVLRVQRILQNDLQRAKDAGDPGNVAVEAFRLKRYSEREGDAEGLRIADDALLELEEQGITIENPVGRKFVDGMDDLEVIAWEPDPAMDRVPDALQEPYVQSVDSPIVKGPDGRFIKPAKVVMSYRLKAEHATRAAEAAETRPWRELPEARIPENREADPVAWDVAVENEIARGRMTTEQAEELGYRRDAGYEWSPLPEELFHVTADSHTVLRQIREGEVEPSEAVLVTGDASVAKASAEAIREGQAFMRGSMEPSVLYERGNRGEGASRPYDPRTEVGEEVLANSVAEAPEIAIPAAWEIYKGFLRAREKAGGEKVVLPDNINPMELFGAAYGAVRVMQMQPRPGARGKIHQDGNVYRTTRDSLRVGGRRVSDDVLAPDVPERSALLEREPDDYKFDRGTESGVEPPAPDPRAAHDPSFQDWNPGPSHVGHIPVKVGGTGRVAKKLILRADKIIRDVAKVFEMPITPADQRRVGPRGREGYSRPDVTVPRPESLTAEQAAATGVATMEVSPAQAFGWHDAQKYVAKDSSSLQTVIHEFGHHLDGKLSPFAEIYRTGHGLEMLHKVMEGLHAGKKLFRLEEVPGEGREGPARQRASYEGEELAGGVEAQHIREMMGVSYDVTLPWEGFAEGFRLWGTHPELLKEIAPKLHEKLEQAVDQLPAKEQKALRKMQKDSHSFLEQTAGETYKEKFGVPISSQDIMDGKMARIRYNLLDDYAGITNMIARTDGELRAGNPSEAFYRARGTQEIIRNVYKWGMPRHRRDANTGERYIEFSGITLDEIIKPPAALGHEALNKAFAYSIARKLRELSGQAYSESLQRIMRVNEDWINEHRAAGNSWMDVTRAKGWSEEMVDSWLAFKDELPGGMAEKFHDGLVEFHQGVLQFAIDGGLVTKKKGDLIRSWNTEYSVPFFRVMDGEVAINGQRILSAGNPMKSQKGSVRNLKDPLANITEGYARIIQAVIDNDAKRGLVEWARGGEFRNGKFLNLTGQGRFLEPFPGSDTMGGGLKALDDHIRKNFTQDYADGNRISFQEAERQLSSLKEGDFDQMTMFSANRSMLTNDVMTVMIDGKAHKYMVSDPLLLDSLRMMSRGPSAVPWWSTARKWRQEFVTHDPSFMTVNFVRDVAMASILSKTGHFHLFKSIRGFRSAFREDKEFRDAIAMGMGGGIVREAPGRAKNQIVREAKTGAARVQEYISPITTVQGVWGALGKIGRAAEYASRVGEYKAARAQGHDRAHSAFLGREVGTDFSRMGASNYYRFLADTIPFFNAMVVGGDRVWRASPLAGPSWFKDPNQRVSMGIKTAGVGLASMLLYDFNRRVPDYVELPDWDKWTSWHFFNPIMLPDGTQKRWRDGRLAFHHHKIPKLWEIGMIGTLAELTTKSMQEDMGIAETFGEAMEIIAANFGFHIYGDGPVAVPLPVGVDMLVEQMRNRINYTGGQIETQRMQTLAPGLRYRQSQPEWIKQAGRKAYKQGVPFNPAKSEALMRTMFGEWYRMGSMLVDDFFYPGGAARHLDEYPIARRFYERAEGKYSNVPKEMADRDEAFGQTYNSIQFLMKNPTTMELGLEMLNDPEVAVQYSLANTVSRFGDMTGPLRKQIDLIQSGALDHQFTGEEAKRDYIQQIRMQIRTMQRSINESLRINEKRGK